MDKDRERQAPAARANAQVGIKHELGEGTLSRAGLRALRGKVATEALPHPGTQPASPPGPG